MNLRLARDRLADRGLRRGKACDRHAIGRTRYVSQADIVSTCHGRAIATMLAANADLEFRPRLAPALNADLHEFADAVAVERDEGIDFQDALGDVGAEEARRVIAADAVGGLR